MTNAEIAAHLVMSVRTVDSHVAAALDKLSVRTRKEAAARAMQLGIATTHTKSKMIATLPIARLRNTAGQSDQRRNARRRRSSVWRGPAST